MIKRLPLPRPMTTAEKVAAVAQLRDRRRRSVAELFLLGYDVAAAARAARSERSWH